VVVEGKSSGIVAVRDQLISELQANSFSDEDIFAVHLAVEEAFINGVKHGNKMDPTKQIKVDYLVDSDRIEVWVTDEGAGFDPDEVPDPRSGRNIYKSNGRGLLLMRSYMDEVEYNENGNTVHMVRFKEKPTL
jgi:serine/threonine-protein kinase RsbW